MTRENLRGAIESNRPFAITMADGRTFDVPHRDFIAFTRKQTAVVLTTEDDYVHGLPLLLMSGVRQQALAEH